VGSRWSYDFARNRVLGPPKAARWRDLRSALLMREVYGHRYSGRSTLALFLDTYSGWQSSGGVFEVAERSYAIQVLAWEAGGLGLFASQPVEDPRRADVALPRQPILRLLPRKLDTGHEWRVGRLEADGFVAELEGRVEQVADLDFGKGVVRRGCLQVRYEGTLEGAVALPSGPTPLRDGRYQRLVWYQPDVGIAKDTIAIRGSVTIPDGSATAYLEVIRLQLRNERVRATR
jgi:hypothetical protein